MSSRFLGYVTTDQTAFDDVLGDATVSAMFMLVRFHETVGVWMISRSILGQTKVSVAELDAENDRGRSGCRIR